MRTQLRQHREMWQWLADHPDKKRSDYDGEIGCAFDGDCDCCPLEWPGGKCMYEYNGADAGLFAYWWLSDNHAERRVLALWIKNLPVREVCDED